MAEPVRLRELRRLAQVDLRVDPSAADRVRRAVGLALPVSPTTASAGGGRAVLWLGPDWWLVVAPPGESAGIVDALEADLAGRHFSVVDVSANRTTLELAGPKARDVLAKGCALDLHPRSFGAGRVAQTAVARAQVVLHQTGDEPAYRLLVRPSFAGYLTAWLRDAMSEYLPAATGARR